MWCFCTYPKGVQVRTTSANATYEESRRSIQELTEWVDAGEVDGDETEAEIGGLSPQLLVEVRLSSRNDQGWGPWGPPGRGDTISEAPEVIADPQWCAKLCCERLLKHGLDGRLFWCL